MGVNEFKLERLNSSNVSQKGIKFLIASGLGDNITVNNISFAQPGSTSDNNFSQNWGGFKRLISVDAILHDDGTDKSTDGSSKITLTQQHDHLMGPGGVIQVGSAVDFKYRTTIYMNGASKTITGSVEDISIRADTSNSNILRVTFNMFEAG